MVHCPEAILKLKGYNSMNKRGGFSPKTKKLLGCIAVALVLGMFAVRGLLMNSGKIDEIMTLSPDKLETKMNRTEVIVQTEGYTGHGTAIDSFKGSTKDETFKTYVATAAHLISEDAKAEEITVTLKDGTAEKATVEGIDRNRDIAVLLIETKEETEVGYLRDANSRVKTDNTVYCMANDGTIYAGTVGETSATIEGVGSDMITVSCENAEGMSGGGVYDASGYYIGMIVQGARDELLAVVPGYDIAAAVKAVN